MLPIQARKPAFLAAICCLFACSSGSPEPTSTRTTDGARTTTTEGASPPSQQPLIAADAGAEGPPPNDCDLDGGCVSQCGAPTATQSATCGVVSPQGVLCELDGFTGASVEVACGQRAIVGTACCGECGCVPVEVFFDGKNCWQGVPTCSVSVWANYFLDPHAPGAVDGGWNPAANDGGVQGEFYLGTTPPDAGDAEAEDSGSEGGPADGAADAGATTTDAGGFDGADGGVADADAGVMAADPDATTGDADTGD
jgi:hypothetical protein